MVIQTLQKNYCLVVHPTLAGHHQ